MITPKIRFHGFEDEWNRFKVSDLCNRFDNLRKPVSANKRIAGSTPYYGANGIQDYVEGHTHEGEFILVAEDGASDLVNYPIQYVSGKIWVNNHAHVLQGKTEKADTCFISYALTQADIQSVLVGGTRAKLNAEPLMTLNVVVPHLKEQKSVGYFFELLKSSVDSNLKLLESLKLLKQSMLQKMFPKAGELQPEIRLEGFEGDWKLFHLNELAMITMGQSPDGSTYSDTPNDYILVQGNADLLNGWVSPRVWTTQVTKTAAAGDLIMSVRAPVGAMGKTAFDVVIGRGVAAIKGNEFIYQSLVKMNSEGYWKKFSSGTTFESINSQHLKLAQIIAPSEEEQQLIGSYFAALDRRIAAQQQKCDQLKVAKQYLLQNMFA